MASLKTTQDYKMPGYLRDFLNYLVTIQGKSPNTMLVYFYDLRLFLRFNALMQKRVPADTPMNDIDIENLDIAVVRDVTLSDLYAFMSHVGASRRNASSARARKVASIRSFYNYLYNKARLLDHNPASELESPKIMKRLPRYLNIDESRKLLTVVDGMYSERDYAILTLFLNCGIRLSELVGINGNHIRNQTLTVIGKGNKERAIPLNDACMEALDQYIKYREAHRLGHLAPLFLSTRKTRISKRMVQEIIKKYISRAGLDAKRYSVHKLRHTAATLMYKYGHVDIRSLQELLGHESIATTEIYTHLDKQQLKDAVDSHPLAGMRKNPVRPKE